ncbi:RE35942p, putative [Brugia malayi]|uniref:Bm6291 n=1 Tax=Brugia malayi TaxID=6279 RepID=A0A0H5S1I8_BRUMA|nr:RE35942p, putative [Brugia malayi]CRZ22343.1 Bm6291 [Brugia malayi]VIO88610.1 RE35942p, putative [Brugia malayi]
MPNKFYAKIGLNSELPCVIMFGMAFMFVFAGFDTQAYITETALQSVSNAYPDRISAHAGYYGMCITYFTFTLSTFITPLVVSYLSAKWTMFLASVLYSTFMVTFMLVNSYVFYIASALMGLAAALIWTGHGVYMKEITTFGNESRNSGLHWGINFISLIFGGLLLLIIFNETGEAETISLELIRYIFGGLSAFTILSNILFALLPNHSNQSITKRDSFLTTIRKSVRLLTDIKVYLLAICFMFMGLSLSLYITIYPSCLSFSKSVIGFGNEIIAYYAFITSASQISGGCFISFLSKRIKNFGYMPTMLIALPLYLLAFLGVCLAFPKNANLKPTNGATYLSPSLSIWLIIGMLICIGDSCWNTLRTAVLTKMYDRESSSQIFALSKFFQSTTTCASFFYSSILDLHTQMIILAVSLIAASICFTIAWKIHLREIEIAASAKHTTSISIVCGNNNP